MSDPTSVARKYLEAWNQTDPRSRRRLIAEHWTGRALRRPLDERARGEQIDGPIASVDRFPVFDSSSSRAERHGEHVRFSWSLGPAGAEPPIKGGDVVELQHGKIAQVIGFLDQVPA
jgi:hypothetical protein